MHQIVFRKRELVVVLLLSFRCLVTVNLIHVYLFPVVPWLGLQCVNVVFPVHTHFFLRFHKYRKVTLNPLLCNIARKSVSETQNNGKGSP